MMWNTRYCQSLLKKSPVDFLIARSVFVSLYKAAEQTKQRRSCSTCTSAERWNEGEYLTCLLKISEITEKYESLFSNCQIVYIKNLYIFVLNS